MNMKTCLLVIDVQKDLFNKKNKVFNEKKIINNINKIIDAFRIKDLPIIFIKHTNDGSMKENSDGWQFHSDLKVKNNDFVMMKRTSSSLKEKNIVDKIKELNIKQLVIVGLVTHGCIKAAALDAANMNYDVIVVGDAHSNFNENAEELINYWNNTFLENGVTINTTDEVIKNISNL